jgi:NAD(P)-dependent dehydrogenase (short-subunit alcohol dehydrogenase family)
VIPGTPLPGAQATGQAGPRAGPGQPVPVDARPGDSRRDEVAGRGECVSLPADPPRKPPSAGAAARADSLFDLTGRVAVITGGTRGLGRAIADAYCRAGADVVVVSRKPEACAAVAAELRAGGGRAVGHPCHVGHWDELAALADRIYGESGRIDVLVNNAGIAPVYGRLADISEELWDKVFAVNLKGPFRLSAVVGERMAAGDGGSVINVSSTGALRPTADIVPYAAAKAGLHAMTAGLAAALGPKVRVNTIVPGPFLTSIAREWDLDQLARRTQAHALRRAGQPDEIAGAALYFASDASAFTTGAVLAVDGGAQWAVPGADGAASQASLPS